MRAEGSIEINGPIDQVFELTIHNVAEWSDVVLEDVVIEEKPGMVGTTFRTVTKTPNSTKTMIFTGEVTHHAPPHLHAAFMQGEQFTMDVVYKFEEQNGKTIVTQTSVVEGKGVMKILFKVMGWLSKTPLGVNIDQAQCDALQQELNRLKHYCENRIEKEVATPES